MDQAQRCTGVGVSHASTLLSGRPRANGALEPPAGRAASRRGRLGRVRLQLEICGRWRGRSGAGGAADRWSGARVAAAHIPSRPAPGTPCGSGPRSGGCPPEDSATASAPSASACRGQAGAGSRAGRPVGGAGLGVWAALRRMLTVVFLFISQTNLVICSVSFFSVSSCSASESESAKKTEM